MALNSNSVLYDKIAVVTGAGSGMGLATVRAFVREGAIVYALDISHENLEREFDGEKAVTPIALDIADSAAVNDAFEQVKRDHDKLDILVNAAGVNTPNRRATEWLDSINHQMMDAMKSGEEFTPEYLHEIPDRSEEHTSELQSRGQLVCRLL